MKKILLIITFLFTYASYACECIYFGITERFVQAEFVASITIIKIYPNKKNESGYKADIRINKLFKGNRLKSIYIAGRTDKTLGTSCDIYIPKNTKLIVYARKNKNGDYGIGMCSGLVYLNGKNIEYEKKELDILKILKSKKKMFCNKTTYVENGSLYKELEQFKGIKLDKKFALFEITLNSELKVENIDLLSGFENSLDKKLLEILLTTKWKKMDNAGGNICEVNNKFLFGIFYYEAEKNNSSFLSQVYL